MSFSKKIFVLLALFASASAARAEETSVASGMPGYLKNVKASYLAWLTGPKAEALSGNVDGTGTKLNIFHLATLGYKFGNYKASFNQQFSQDIDEDSTNRAIDVLDPYVQLSHSKIYSNERYGASMSGFIRYYLPLSPKTIGDNDHLNGTGNGVVRAGLSPTISFLSGDLSFGVPVLYSYRFASHSAAERSRYNTTHNNFDGSSRVQKQWYAISPIITYQLNAKLSASLEYSTGRYRQYTDDTWTRPATPDDYGQTISPSLSWDATKKLNLNPYVSWGPVFRGLKKTDIGLIANYAFL